VDQERTWDIPFATVVTDAGYGDSPTFLQGLEDRQVAYVVAVSSTFERGPAQPVRDRAGPLGDGWRSSLPAIVAFARDRRGGCSASVRCRRMRRGQVVLQYPVDGHAAATASRAGLQPLAY
jgi:hypothetical protein